MKDPLALWRNKDPLSLSEAAALVWDVPPGRTYPNKAPELTAEMRQERDGVAAVLTEILTAAKTGALPAKLKHKRVAVRSEAKNFATSWENDRAEARHERYRDVLDPSGTYVTLADLEAWCAARGIKPDIFQNANKRNTTELGTLEREGLLALVGTLCELAGIDLRKETKGHAEAKRLAGALEARRVSLTPETVAKRIAAAREVIHPRGPEALEDSNSNRARSNSKK